jgi:hypothetical protein
MGASVPKPVDAMPRKTLARPCVKPELRQADLDADLLFACIEATAGKFKQSGKEMAALLRVTESNYSRRSYNTARVAFLPLDMRRYFTKQLAKADGLRADHPTPEERIVEAAKDTMLTLLDLIGQKTGGG